MRLFSVLKYSFHPNYNNTILYNINRRTKLTDNIFHTVPAVDKDFIISPICILYSKIKSESKCVFRNIIIIIIICSAY